MQGFFAEHLARAFGPAVRVTLVDVDAKRLRQARSRMALRGRSAPPPSNLAFLAGDAAVLSGSGALEGVDVAVGLHACGGLSDLIIAHAVEQVRAHQHPFLTPLAAVLFF